MAGLTAATQDGLAARVATLEAQVRQLENVFTNMATGVSHRDSNPAPQTVATDVATTPQSSPGQPVATKVPTSRTTPGRSKAKPRGAGFAG